MEGLFQGVILFSLHSCYWAVEHWDEQCGESSVSGEQVRVRWEQTPQNPHHPCSFQLREQQVSWSLPEQGRERSLKSRMGHLQLFTHRQRSHRRGQRFLCMAGMPWTEVEEYLQDDSAAWAMMWSGSCLNTFVLDFNFRLVFILHNTESALLPCSSLIPSWVISKGYIHWEPFNVLLKFTELSLSRFWPTSVEAAQPWRKYSCDWGLYWWDFATSLSESDLELSLDSVMALPWLQL